MIHQTLVDLLTIQQEIHPGIFAVIDGTFAGDGPGPPRVRAALETQWGQLFKSYGDGEVAMLGREKKTVLQAVAGLTVLAALTAGLAWLVKNQAKRTH